MNACFRCDRSNYLLQSFRNILCRHILSSHDRHSKRADVILHTSLLWGYKVWQAVVGVLDTMLLFGLKTDKTLQLASLKNIFPELLRSTKEHRSLIWRGMHFSAKRNLDCERSPLTNERLLSGRISPEATRRNSSQSKRNRVFRYHRLSCPCPSTTRTVLNPEPK